MGLNGHQKEGSVEYLLPESRLDGPDDADAGFRILCGLTQQFR